MEQGRNETESPARLRRCFLKVYGSGLIDQRRITDAIAAFEGTLETPGSRFDRYLQGDANAINARARSAAMHCSRRMVAPHAMSASHWAARVWKSWD
jgi:cytochrome c peroxidase